MKVRNSKGPDYTAERRQEDSKVMFRSTYIVILFYFSKRKDLAEGSPMVSSNPGLLIKTFF